LIFTIIPYIKKKWIPIRKSKIVKLKSNPLQQDVKDRGFVPFDLPKSPLLRGLAIFSSLVSVKYSLRNKSKLLPLHYFKSLILLPPYQGGQGGSLTLKLE